MRLHPVETRSGRELIVFYEHKDFVVRTFAAVACGQKNSRSVVRIAPAKVFISQKGFELVVERSDFGASHFARERKRNVSALDLRSEVPMVCRNAHLARPESIGTPRD